MLIYQAEYNMTNAGPSEDTAIAILVIVIGEREAHRDPSNQGVYVNNQMRTMFIRAMGLPICAFLARKLSARIVSPRARIVSACARIVSPRLRTGMPK